MLNLSAVPIVDNHCHPVLLNQTMDTLRFRRFFTESYDPIFAEQHIQNTVYYLWMLRQMASFYGCSNTEDAILATRNKLDSISLTERLFRAANIDTLVLDTGFPPPVECLSPEQMGQSGHCRTIKLLRLEVLMQQLVVEYSDFDELVERFAMELSDIRGRGYAGLKSIVAYRGGLQVIERSKDEAALSFDEARSVIRNNKLRITQSHSSITCSISRFATQPGRVCPSSFTRATAIAIPICAWAIRYICATCWSAATFTL